MDVFIQNQDTVAYSIDSCIGRDRCWRVERFEGSQDALEHIERIRQDEETKEWMTKSDCGATRTHDLLESTPNSRVFYTYLEDLHRCHSVVGHAARHLDLGIVFQTRRSGATHEWRMLTRSEENVDTFFDVADDHLRDGVSLHLDRLREAQSWSVNSLSAVSITEVQQEILRAAVERGYYDTPREITITELASELDIPSSTVSYRLRQAEAELANGFIDSHLRQS